MSVLRRLAAVPAGRRTKWLVLVFWLVAVGVAGQLAGRLPSVEKNEPSSFLPSSAESTEVLDTQRRLPGGDTLAAVVGYVRASGVTAADVATVTEQARELSGLGFVVGPVPPPARSADGQALRLTVPIRMGDGLRVGDHVTTIRQAVRSAGGLVTHVTGPAGVQADSAEVFKNIDSTLLSATLVVVVVILLFTYRSPFLWFIPVLGAGVSLSTAQAANYLLARYGGLTVNGQSAGILLVLVFGAGTDYALLLVARYREELRRHADRHEAMTFALRRSGTAILASGITVIVGLLCLLAARLNSNRGLGPVAAVGIGCALLAMLTLLPALLVIAGRWVFWPFVPHLGDPRREESGVWGRLARRVARRPRAVWIGTTVVLGVLCVGLVTLRANGLSDAQSFRTTPDSIRGEQVLDRHFPAGSGNPAVVVGRASHADVLTAAVRGTDGVGPVDPRGSAAGLVALDAVLRDPTGSQAAFDTIDRLRAAVHAVPGADAKVGGSTAVNLDVQRAASHDTRLIIPVVLGVVFCVLALLLRALVAPLLLMATVVLSFAAALGVSAFAFDVLFHFGGADSSFPLFAFIFLVALGIDYNIFLMTRVREEARHTGTRAAAVTAVTVTGGVITSAGIVLAATFGVLWVLPLVALAEVGFAVAFGVLLDTMVARSILVPALTIDVGDPVWWPGSPARGAGTAELPAFTASVHGVCPRRRFGASVLGVGSRCRARRRWRRRGGGRRRVGCRRRRGGLARTGRGRGGHRAGAAGSRRRRAGGRGVRR